MTNIPKTYDFKSTEERLYNWWEQQGYFKPKNQPQNEGFDPNVPTYVIAIPPPNVTGELHLGHAMFVAMEDLMIRYHRMCGLSTLWVPGSDHAGIATQLQVEKSLSAEGTNREEIGRTKFLERAWDWKHEYGGNITNQLRRLGASCDWERTKFTMDDDMSESVIKVFVDLHNKGLIYRGVRMVNWDPSAQTALSDEEVIHKEVNSQLYHIAYDIEGSDEKLTIATTRPETILGDSAICVNPNDTRYTHLKGKNAIIPLLERVIPIIFDEYVDMEFGTGALKITPAHDINDYLLGDKHGLETIDILNDNGTLSEAATLYIGKDRFVVRNEIAVDLKAKGYLVKTEDYQNKVGFSERTDAVIEPKLSMQWFCKMEEFSKPALEHVMNDDIKFHPPKFKNTYRHWMENIKDWCVSRQLWWGQQIPAYFYDGNKYVVAESKEEALALAQKEKPSVTMADLRQDADVLDTWFSSWLWPISVFDGIRNPDNEEINYYYPTNDLVTAPEILFFWVARMIMAGYEYKRKLPFKNVYLTGIVRDKKGRKMSKSLGNSPDPITLMEKYGADGVRVGMLLCSPAGNDLPFDEGLCEQGRNFSNKIWNAFRLIKGWEVANCEQPESAKQAINWFENKISKAITEINESYSKYRISEALMGTYKLVWDDFCSWYLEMVKPNYGSPMDSTTYTKTIEQLEKVLKLLHPFMPFLSEEIWHLIDDRKEDIIIAEWPKTGTINEQLLSDFENTTEVVAGIRTIRKEQNIANKNQLELLVINNQKATNDLDAIIAKLGNISDINITKEKPSGTFSFMVKSNEYFIPLGDNIDIESEIEKLKKELDYTKGFLKSVKGKLSNERFVNNAPEQVVVNEKNKMADAKAKIEILEIKIKSLSKE